MSDLVLDTGPLADVLAQYFQIDDYISPSFVPSDSLSLDVVRQINRIVRMNGYYVVASAIAFVELTRKWSEIVQDRFTFVQLAAFLQSPPEWFVVAAVDEDLLPSFRYVPPFVTMPNGRTEQIEWTDAVHIATSLSRERCHLVTTDHRIQQVLEMM